METGTETTCGSLLRELQHIWDEVGENDEDRDRMLLQLEQECLEVYRRKVDQANHGRARLHRALADAEAELAALVSVLGERPVIIENRHGTLKEQYAAICPHVEDMRSRKDARAREMTEVKLQIRKLRSEIEDGFQEDDTVDDDDDLTLRKLEEFQLQLQVLHKEKADRLKAIMEYVNVIHDLCSVLALNFHETVAQVHPSLKDTENVHLRSISNETLEKLQDTIQRLQEEKKERVFKLQDLGACLVQLWNLMDTSSEEQNDFQHVTRHLGATIDEISSPGTLSFDVIEKAEVEVERLNELKVSKMKELVLKKHVELEDICRRAHMKWDAHEQEKIIASIDSGLMNPADLLATMEDHIRKAREEAFNRKDIMEKIEKWVGACEEEKWLEEYDKDENRYSATRGAHLNLKRAERARATVNKLPALVESLKSKAKSWDNEKGYPFLYDGESLLDMLENYISSRQQKEEEKKRMRDHKRLQEQFNMEQEVMFGSRPSPSKPSTAKKSAARQTGATANRRLSLGGPGTPDIATPRINGATPSRLGTRENKKERPRPVHVLGVQKEDTGAPYQLNFSDRKPLTPVAQLPAKSNLDLLSPLKPVSAVKFNTSFGMGNNNKGDEQQVPAKKINLELLSPLKPVAAVKLNINFGTETESRGEEKGEALTPTKQGVPTGRAELARLEEKYQSLLSPEVTRNAVVVKEQDTEYSFEERRLLCLNS